MGDCQVNLRSCALPFKARHRLDGFEMTALHCTAAKFNTNKVSKQQAIHTIRYSIPLMIH